MSLFPDHTTVVHRDEPHDVYIGRPSKWGNPFREGVDGTREEVITKFAAWIRTQPDLLNEIHTLKGKRLGCWCAPKPCHGDVLANLANRIHGEEQRKWSRNKWGDGGFNPTISEKRSVNRDD